MTIYIYIYIYVFICELSGPVKLSLRLICRNVYVLRFAYCQPGSIANGKFRQEDSYVVETVFIQEQLHFY